MKKIINDPADCARDALVGYLQQNPGLFKPVEGVLGYVREGSFSKAAVLVGGGSGHDPMFTSFVGPGMADALINGQIFASPDPMSILEVIKAANENCGGNGVLLLYGNYAGDNLNFGMAKELAEMEGIKVKIVTVREDAASAPRERRDDRRGTAGDVFAMKIAGAASDLGYNLEELAAVAEKAVENMASVAIALGPGSLPGKDPNFSLAEDEIEFGIGIHGEPGIRREKIAPADQLTQNMMSLLIGDLGLKKGDNVCLLFNSLGATTLMELNIMSIKAHKMLEEMGISVYDADSAHFCTTQEMAGASITIMKLDDELKKLYDIPALTPVYHKNIKL